MCNAETTYDFLGLWLTGRMNDKSYTDDYGHFSIYIDGSEIYLDDDDKAAYYDMFDNLTKEQVKIGMSFHKKEECDFCNGSVGDYTSSNKDYYITTFLTMNSDFILSFVPDNDNIDIDKDYIKLPYKYCPMCGRKLNKG